MRFISTRPEFSWSGTGFILLAATIIGLLLGLAVGARRNRWGRWAGGMARGTAGASAILLGVGAGTAVVPTIILGGLALSRRRLHWALRALVVAVAVAVAFLMFGRSPGGPVWMAAALVAAAAAVLVILGRGVRLIFAGLAIAAAVGVGASLFSETLPTWRGWAGSILYAALLVPAVMGYAAGVRSPIPPVDDSAHEPITHSARAP
ncbi:MAG TPA: hypothetical protein VML96_13865 [Egibacteraceae bacterium]|nr:hypothetical protein [Egibacteraceae bacterium]